MSNLRIKIVYEDDIRMFKAKSDTQDLLGKIMIFIKEAHNIKTFRLVFKDNEGDEITIVDDDDLKEALTNNNNNKTTKLFVKTIQQEKDEEQIENEDEDENNGPYHHHRRHHHHGHRHHHRGHHHHRGRGRRHHRGHHHGHGRRFFSEEETEDDENNNNNFNNDCIWLKFLDDVSEDKELKKEFISFLTTFITSLQNTTTTKRGDDEENNEGTLNNGSELFIKALSLHDKLNKHEIIAKFVSEKLDLLFYQFPHLLDILKQINVQDIPKFIDLILEFNNCNKNNNCSPKSNNFPMLPPFLFPFLGLFNCKYQSNKRQGSGIPPFCLAPPFWGGIFGGFRGHHGRRHHHRGRHHGHHGFGHGRRFFGGRGGCGRGFRGGMRKQCGRGFFNQSFFEQMNNNNNYNFEKCKKHKDLRADIINENITLGSNAFVNGNQTLIKTWKMKNVGKKVIPANCTIQYFGRKFNLMIDGTKFELKNKEIQLNEEFEVSVVIKSPKENGKYKSKWKLVTLDGSKFGQPLIVSFIVNDFNNNNKEFKKLRKEERKNFKKQEKYLKKEEKIVKKEEKLRNKKEKLLEKLQKLEEQSNQLNNINDDDKDDIKEEIVEENNNNNDIIDLNEDEIIVIENDKVTLEGGDDDKFIYKVQLEQLKNMGFNDENQLKKLLELNDGSIEAVLNHIM